MKYFKEILLSVSFLTIGYSLASFFNKVDATSGSPLTTNISENATSHNEVDQQITSNFNGKDPHLISKNIVDTTKEIIANMPESQLNDYLAKAFPNTDLSKIQNKKRFSERLIEELSTSDNSSSATVGTLTLSKTMNPSIQSDNVRQVYKNQQLFAHYDTLGKVPRSDQVFVKWTNQDTGEILLFTPQKVNSLSDQNWISYSPPDGWKTGSYAIEYYEYNDNLNPIAKESYEIHQVLD